MFFAIPLANKPTWQSPPWMTVLLIVANMLIYWGWQASEDQKVERNAERYAASGLAASQLAAAVLPWQQRKVTLLDADRLTQAMLRSLR